MQSPTKTYSIFTVIHNLLNTLSHMIGRVCGSFDLAYCLYTELYSRLLFTEIHRDYPKQIQPCEGAADI